MWKLLCAGVAIAAVALIALAPGRPATRADAAGITLEEIAPGTSSPVSIVNAGDGSDRLFVVEQSGKVRVINSSRTLLGPAYIDISPLVLCCGEQGLLNIAFHPSFETNGRFFLYYVNTSGNLAIAGYDAPNPAANVSGAGAPQTIITIPHPDEVNHNGGALVFGPDGYLYAGIGDGGGIGDPKDNAQNINSLLGKIIRLDIDGGTPYAIPAGNPFAGPTPGADEIWAVGVRNPWRISFDRLNGDLYIGDVGQNQREEVNRQLAGASGGANYGWRFMEGTICYNPASGCDPGGLTNPVIEYTHAEGACSITGGYRYRGVAPSLAGQYVYGDLCNGKIWGATLTGSTWTSALLLDTTSFISTFGEDEAGELYFADPFGSKVYRIVPDLDSDTDGDEISDTNDNCVLVPNPGQENSDGNFTDLSPPKAYDDRTWPNADTVGDACDVDDDNDGRTDVQELEGTDCGVFTTPTNPILRDSDGDLMLDGAECESGMNPAAPNSAAAIAAACPVSVVTPDDGDGILPERERCYYNTDPNVANTDGDPCDDGREVASINADINVNAIDLAQVAQAFYDYSGDPYPFLDERYTFDINKDRKINVIDLSQVAQRFGGC